MTPVKVSIIATLASLVLLAVVFELIRGRKLKERYALLWILTGVVLLVLSAWPNAISGHSFPTSTVLTTSQAAGP